MLLTPDHPDFETTLVFLDGKLCRSFLAADDEAGWVEVPDLSAMAPIDLTEDGASQVGEEAVEGWNEVPTKKRTGQVEFRKLTAKS